MVLCFAPPSSIQGKVPGGPECGRLPFYTADGPASSHRRGNPRGELGEQGGLGAGGA